MLRLHSIVVIICIVSCLPLAIPAQVTYKKEITVAHDGSGDFTSLQEAINSRKAFPEEYNIIRIKPGTYKEKIEVSSWLTKVRLIGEDPLTTIITFDDYSGKGGINTFTSYTVKVTGNDFYAENITFENAAGLVGQAVAIHVEADRCVFYNCRFIGNQDTIYTGGERSRQYFKKCYIEGTTDFIFGGATALFEDCHIHSKKNSYVTAASTAEGHKFGYVFKNCTLTAAPDITKVYLGRPWRNYAKTVFINCNLGEHIVKEGWHNWNKPDAEKTTFYAEYKSTGKGASPGTRVQWSKQLTRQEVAKYTTFNILGGIDKWKPEIRR
ncbi:pectinesterase family protein [Chryseosolibacter indicus]|uniref:Pectinesterase n=1 Tax=Chryseosolibacter indicus TaxID=2782351 RepID=A0ABS5VR56_9BACT|nr:pectinesterase family protein [Chryseosolibacter indicus]MBT1703930.1 pectin esterase [Chryseosolibacter indicus]